MKNNFSNFVKIIAIIIGIVLVIWLVFFLITKNDYSLNHITSTPVEEDSNIPIIVEELTTIFSYINNTKESENIACLTLGDNLGYDITSNTNFFDYYAPVIMDCLYEKNYPIIIYNDELSYKIVTEEEWKNYAYYFMDLSEVNSLKDIYTVDILNTYSTEDINSLEYYIDGNYKIAYPISSHPKENEITYSINRIFKNKNNYVVEISAIIDDIEYKGNLKINVVDGHCQYESLFFY